MNQARIFGILAIAASLALGACGVGDAQSHLRTAVDARQASLNECYRQALERSEETSGVMHVRLHMPKGANAVEQVEVMDSNLGDEALEQCVVGALDGVRIDEAPKANMAVDYTFRFSPSSS